MKRTTITLTDDLADLLDHEARRRRVSLSELARRLIRDSLGLCGRSREIPWAGIFQDPAMVSGETLDDELTKHWAHDIDRDR